MDQIYNKSKTECREEGRMLWAATLEGTHIRVTKAKTATSRDSHIQPKTEASSLRDPETSRRLRHQAKDP